MPVSVPGSPQELFYEDRHFHEGCFRCCRCQRSLADEPFTCQDSELLCNDCYCSAFSSQCSACGETVMPGTFLGARGAWDWRAHPIHTWRLGKALHMQHVPENLLCP